MAQSLAQILIHVVFSTKARYPYLRADVRPELHAYTATVLKSLDSPVILVNSVDDHAHVLCHLSKNNAACDLIQKVKTSTSKWLKTKGGILTKFRWQNGYGAFSVSPSQADSVRKYIEDQEIHHRKVSFQDEFRRLISGHGLELDERYVWD
ncbi:MAG: IS200/IS605 family transposase [Planctomycetota bacterium]|jgi:REP element-mobilizing transposase RayT